MKKLASALLLLLALNDCSSQSTYVDSRTGIIVSFVTDDEMYPESWRGGEIKGTAIPLEESEYERSKNLVTKALAKYPVKVLKSNLKKIYVLNHISFYGVGYGGTNSTDAVYLTNQGEEKYYTDLYVEQIFHEEFSSILLRNFPAHISEYTWSDCASDSISYGGTGVDAIKNGKAGETFDARLNDFGFLGEYATSNFENDLNSFAKNIFCPKADFWTLIETYPRLKCKLDTIIKFYGLINVKFTEEYFEKWK
jgi:hypothetical protein